MNMDEKPQQSRGSVHGTRGRRVLSAVVAVILGPPLAYWAFFGFWAILHGAGYDAYNGNETVRQFGIYLPFLAIVFAVAIYRLCCYGSISSLRMLLARMTAAVATLRLPRRRWFRFSLRTMLVVVTVLPVPLGWAAYHLNWIRQRHAALARWDASSLSIDRDDKIPPWQLRLFGERGPGGSHLRINVFNVHSKEARMVLALFPEFEGAAIAAPLTSDRLDGRRSGNR